MPTGIYRLNRIDGICKSEVAALGRCLWVADFCASHVRSGGWSERQIRFLPAWGLPSSVGKQQIRNFRPPISAMQEVTNAVPGWSGKTFLKT